MVRSVQLGYRKLIGRPGPLAFNASSPLVAGGDRERRKHPLNPSGLVCGLLSGFLSVNVPQLRVMTKSATHRMLLSSKSMVTG